MSGCEYEKPTFTVSGPSVKADPTTCAHPWVRPNGLCYYCGANALKPRPYTPADAERDIAAAREQWLRAAQEAPNIVSPLPAVMRAAGADVPRPPDAA